MDIANRAPKAGVRTRRAGERAAAAAGNVPLCWAKIHCSARKPRRTPTHDTPLIKPMPIAHAALTNQAVDRRVAVCGPESATVLMRLPPEQIAIRSCSKASPLRPLVLGFLGQQLTRAKF